MGKLKRKSEYMALFFENIFFAFQGYKIDLNESYLCRVLNSEQYKTNPVFVHQKLNKELNMGGISNFGSFLG